MKIRSLLHLYESSEYLRKQIGVGKEHACSPEAIQMAISSLGPDDMRRLAHHLDAIPRILDEMKDLIVDLRSVQKQP